MKKNNTKGILLSASYMFWNEKSEFESKSKTEKLLGLLSKCFWTGL